MLYTRKSDSTSPGPRTSIFIVRILGFALAALLALPARAQEEDPRIKRIGETVERLMKANRIPGTGLAVIVDGKIAWARGYGVAEAGTDRNVDPETLFQAASISKPVAATAALRFVADGKLKLDEDVNAKLASWKVPGNDLTAEKKVTLRRLLSHSAGLSVHGFPGYAEGAPAPTLTQVLDGKPPANTGPIRVTLVPGERFRYSGGGYCVMQQLLEDVGGKPFAKLMDERVLRPLEMKRSTYAQPLPKDRRANAATAHDREGRPYRGRWHTYPEQAAAGLWTTPTDLARFALAIRKAWKDGSGPLPQNLARQMLEPQAGDRIGLGLFLQGERFHHGGSNAGFRCLMQLLKEPGHGAVVMTNSDLGGRMFNELFKEIAREYAWSK